MKPVGHLRHLLGWTLHTAGMRERSLPASQLAAILTYGTQRSPRAASTAEGVTAEETCDGTAA